MNLIENENINFTNFNIETNFNDNNNNEININNNNNSENDSIETNQENFGQKMFRNLIFYSFAFIISFLFLITIRNLVIKNNQNLHFKKMRILEENQNEINSLDFSYNSYMDSKEKEVKTRKNNNKL